MVAYGKYLTTAVIHYGRCYCRHYYNAVKNVRLRIKLRDYGIIVAPGSLLEGKGPIVGVYREETYLLVYHLETTDAERETSSFYTLRPSKQPLDGMHAYPSM